MYLNNFYEIQGKCVRRADDNPLEVYCNIEGLKSSEIYFSRLYEKPAEKTLTVKFYSFKIIATALILAIIV